ncbi:MAG: hypothetical protein U0836_19335 [Pirellulales bacterium]
MSRLRTIAASVLILAVLALIFIDGIPARGLFHDRLRQRVNPLLYATGLYQGPWSVFTPRVDRENHHLELHIEYDNGESVDWRSPPWNDLSTLDKLTRFRELEYHERLFAASNRPVRAAFAHFMTKELQPTATAKPIRIVMTYHYSSTEPPAKGDHQLLPAASGHPNVITLYSEGPAR